MREASAMPVTASCQPPCRGEMDAALKPSISVQNRTDLSMSATVKLVWLNPVIIRRSSEIPISGPAAVHFQRVPCDIARAIGRQQKSNSRRNLLFSPEPAHRGSPVDRGHVETAAGGQRSSRLIHNVARCDRIDANAPFSPFDRLHFC